MAGEVRIHRKAFEQLLLLEPEERQIVFQYLTQTVVPLRRASDAGDPIPVADKPDHVFRVYRVDDFGLEFAIKRSDPYTRTLLRIRYRCCNFHNTDDIKVGGRQCKKGVTEMASEDVSTLSE